MDASHSLLIRSAVWHSGAARGPSTPSLDHLVGEREQCRRNLQTQRVGGVQIDDKMKLGLLQDRQGGRVLALKNPAAVDAGLPGPNGPVRSIAHQPPGFREDTIDVDRRHTVSHRQHRNLDAALDEQISWSDYQGARLLLHDTAMSYDRNRQNEINLAKARADLAHA